MSSHRCFRLASTSRLMLQAFAATSAPASVTAAIGLPLTPMSAEPNGAAQTASVHQYATSAQVISALDGVYPIP